MSQSVQTAPLLPSKLTSSSSNDASASNVPANSPKKRIVRRKKKQLTPKQKLVKQSAEQRFKIEKLVFIWQEKLFSQPQVSPDTLRCASTYLQPQTFEEVVEERSVQSWCGYPLCDNQPQEKLQKYKISLSQRKVFDQTELSKYCSDACFKKSKYYVMQLNEEPIWFRDLNVVSNVHIISLDQDFKSTIQDQIKLTQTVKTNEDIRKDYVQRVLSTVPKDSNEKFKIVEKATVAPPTAPNKPKEEVYDTVEGYRIEIKKSDKAPTTMTMRKLKTDEVNNETKEELDPQSDPQSEEAMFETMMMLKDMNLDKEDQSDKVIEMSDTSKPKEEKTFDVKKDKNAKKRVAFKDPMLSSSSTSSNPPKSSPLSSKEMTATNVDVPKKEDTNIINVTTKQQQPKTKKSDKKQKKKSNVPELSLFGTIWTMLDHMTTKTTRTYLSELQNNNQRVDVAYLLSEELAINETMYLRGQIFSERILDTYSLIRTQLGIRENLEDDIVNVIKTFKLSDASMIALNHVQTYMMVLVLIKTLADILLHDDTWKKKFEACCNTIDQSTDMVDACVRVLKVASV